MFTKANEKTEARKPLTVWKNLAKTAKNCEKTGSGYAAKLTAAKLCTAEAAAALTAEAEARAAAEAVKAWKQNGSPAAEAEAIAAALNSKAAARAALTSAARAARAAEAAAEALTKAEDLTGSPAAFAAALTEAGRFTALSVLRYCESKGERADIMRRLRAEVFAGESDLTSEAIAAALTEYLKAKGINAENINRDIEK